VKRRGVRVRARKGFWALTPANAARAASLSKPPPSALVTRAIETLAADRSRLVKTWVGVRPGPDAATITFVWERTAAAPDAAPAAVSLSATGAAGARHIRWPLDQMSARTGVARFTAPPGSLQLRVVVTNAAEELLDSEVRDVAVEAGRGFGTPEVFRARTAREMTGLREAVEAVPTAERTFSRADRLLIRVPTASSASDTSAPAARLLESGGAVVTLPIARSVGATGVDFEISLATLARGTYVLEITAIDSGGEWIQGVAFQIG
jgi:hypothetical protein